MFPEETGLVGRAKIRARSGGLSAVNAITASALLLQGNAAHGGAGFFLDFGFALGTSAPEGEGKAILDSLLQSLSFRIVLLLLRKARPCREAIAGFLQQPPEGSGQIGERCADLSFPAGAVTARETAACLATSLGQVPRAEYAPHLPIVEFQPGLWPSRSSSVTRMLALTSSAFSLRAVSRTTPFLVRLEDRNDDDLIRRKFRRQDKALIVAVDHNMANDARGEPHDVVQQCCNWPFWSRYLTSKAWRNSVPENEMCRLQRLAVAHHRFNRIGDVRAGKFLGIGFFPDH